MQREKKRMTLLSFLTVTVLIAPWPRMQGASCTYGPENTLQQSDESATAMPGLYLDTSHPVTCNGMLKQWTVCYYRNLFRNRDYEIELQVWRKMSNDQYSMVSTTSFLLEDVSSQDPEFSCEDFPLPTTDYIEVENGDLIGVYLMLNTEGFIDTTLRLVGSGSDVDLIHFIDQMPSEMLQLSDLSVLSTVRIHISASIDAIVEATTTAKISPTTLKPISTNIDTEDDPITTFSDTGIPSSPSSGGQGDLPRGSGSGGLSGGAVAGIIIALLLLIAVGAAVIVITVVLYKRRNLIRFKLTTTGGSNFSLSNVVYEAPVQKGNTSMFSHLDKGIRKGGQSYEVPLNKDGQYQPVPERKSQESIYVDMEGAQSAMKQTKTPGLVAGNYPEADKSDPFNFQETGGIPYYDSFDEVDDSDEEYAEMSNPARNSEEGSTRKPFNIYASFGPKDFNYNNYMKRVSQGNSTQVSWLYDTNNDPYQDPPEEEDTIVHNLSENIRTLKKSAIELKELMMKGDFVEVRRGVWKGKDKDLNVVVKSLVSGSTEKDGKLKLLREAAIMCQFHHPNIIQFYGIVNEENMTMLVTELTDKRSLIDVLKSTKPDPGQMVGCDVPSTLLSYSQQVALGMHYLATKGFIHRSLQAKNMFVTRDNICKIGELALSKDLADTDYYVSQGSVISVGWTAPEVLCYSKYSTASDVWSYGCLLYEIWSLGKVPFEELPDEEINEKLQGGIRLSPPPGCPKKIYSLMMQCWNPLPNSRPGFHTILNNLLEDENTTLHVPIEDAATHNQASHLGGPLKAGEKMYKALQESYFKNRFSIVNGEMLYEAIDQYQSSSASSANFIDYPAPYSEHCPNEPSIQKQPLPAPPSDDIYDDVDQAPAPYSEHTPSEPLIKNVPLPPLPSVVDSDDIYEDTASIGEIYSKHTPNKPLTATNKRPPPSPPGVDDIYEDTADIGNTSHKYIPNMTLTALNKHPPPSPPSGDDIYDDIANTVASNTSQAQNKPRVSTSSSKPPLPPPPCDDNEELYDDIESSLDKFSRATSYEVPEVTHKQPSKPPLPSGPRPPLLYEDPTDIDYEEI